MTNFHLKPPMDRWTKKTLYKNCQTRHTKYSLTTASSGCLKISIFKIKLSHYHFMIDWSLWLFDPKLWLSRFRSCTTTGSAVANNFGEFHTYVLAFSWVTNSYDTRNLENMSFHSLILTSELFISTKRKPYMNTMKTTLIIIDLSPCQVQNFFNITVSSEKRYPVMHFKRLHYPWDSAVSGLFFTVFSVNQNYVMECGYFTRCHSLRWRQILQNWFSRMTIITTIHQYQPLSSINGKSPRKWHPWYKWRWTTQQTKESVKDYVFPISPFLLINKKEKIGEKSCVMLRGDKSLQTFKVPQMSNL